LRYYFCWNRISFWFGADRKEAPIGNFMLSGRRKFEKR
jgi:hypothetical protein